MNFLISVRNAGIPPKHDRTDVVLGQPDKHWCPWNSNTCSNKLPLTGKGTVEIMLEKSMPFELHLSNRAMPTVEGEYKISLLVDNTEARLSVNGTARDSSTLIQHILHKDDGKWHTYWLSIFDSIIKYGVGEVRDAFTIFNITVPETEKDMLKQVSYLHVKMNNNENMLGELKDIKGNVRFFFGKEPVVRDPAMFIIPQDKYSIQIKSAIPPSELEKPCQSLYASVVNFSLNTPDFPEFVEAIERSIKNSNGWCHKKLEEKANRFGRPNPMATYLRITFGQKLGTSPGHAYVIEIWPPGHFSPIHNHSSAYGIIRVLHGRLLAKVYPELTIKPFQYAPIEQILEQDQVTWMLPKLNQTHQIRNPDLYGSSAISIQCYQYGKEDSVHYEYFDYLANDGGSIAQFNPTSDMDYDEFKDLMKKEWDQFKKT